MSTSPTNCIETSLKNLCGTVHPVKNVAYKINSGLGAQGYTVVKTAQVDRLANLLNELYSYDGDDHQQQHNLEEALTIVGGWK